MTRSIKIFKSFISTLLASPKKIYWKILAERRQVALHDALEENKILSDQIKVYKDMLEDSRALVEVLQV